MFNAELALKFSRIGFFIFPLYRSTSTDRPWVEAKGWNRFPGGLPSDGRIEPEKGEVPATSDESSIRQWANSAVTVGYGICAPFNLIFDLDVKHGKNGVTEFTDIKARFGVPNPSLIVKTKSGGLHLYYAREPDLVPAKVGKATDLRIDQRIHAGVDLIANSGYVVGPAHEGTKDDWAEGRYTLIKANFDALTVCPTEVYRGQIRTTAADRVVARSTTADELIVNAYQSEDDDLMGLIRAGKVPEKIPAGRRDSLLTSLIGVLKARRLPRDTVRMVCDKFLENCELAIGETREQFLKAIGLDSKLSRFYSVPGDVNDPRVVARELVDIGKCFKLVDQLPGAVAFIAMADNGYLSPRIIYTETKARQDLAPFARPIPDSENKRPVNPLDLVMRDSSMPRVHSTGYIPKPVMAYIDPADGTERVNLYVPPQIPIGCRNPSGVVQRYEDLVYEICGDMTDYFLDFMAHVVQRPWIKMGQALLIISHAHGSGKNTLVQVMKPLIGPKNYLPVSGLSPLVEDKSVVMDCNVLVVFNEVSRPANRNAWTDMSRAVNKLKTAISESSAQINPKYERQRTITTYSNFVMLSNDDCPYDLDQGDRRIAVVNNDPPKLDQAKFGPVADFAHNEKNMRLTPREYEDMVFEFNEFFRARKVSHNLTTADAPMGEAKRAMLTSMASPIAQALRDFRMVKSAGTDGRFISEDMIIYILRHRLGFKEFGKDRGRYDIFEQFVDNGIVHRLGQKGNQKKARVIVGLPALRDREDSPLIGPIRPLDGPSKTFVWADQGLLLHDISDAAVRDELWTASSRLRDPNPTGKSDVLSIIK